MSEQAVHWIAVVLASVIVACTPAGAGGTLPAHPPRGSGRPSARQRSAAPGVRSTRARERSPLDMALAALGRRPTPDFAAALRAARRVRARGPDGRLAQLNAAYCLLHLNRLAEAEALYRQLDPASDRRALLGLVEVLVRQGRPQRALPLVLHWLHGHPRDGRMRSVAAYLFRVRKAYDKALAQIQQALALDRTNPRAYEEFGRLYLDRKAPRTALMILNRGLRAHPKDAGLLFARGQAFMAQNEPGKAIMDYERAVRADSLFVAARLHLGKIYVDNLDYRGALRHFRAVIAQWPEHLEARLGQARSLFGLKQFRKALAAYRRILAKHPNEPRALYQVGRIYQDYLDQPKAALLYFERYVRARPHLPKNDPVWATLRMLRALSRPRPRRPRPRSRPRVRAPQGGMSR